MPWLRARRRRAPPGAHVFPSRRTLTKLARGDHMANRELTADNSVAGSASNGAGVYLAVLQLAFTLMWTVYAIYLPKLAASVGIAPSAVIVILMVDQLIFTVTDTAMGGMADRIARVV
eukprot:gene33267-44537_t